MSILFEIFVIITINKYKAGDSEVISPKNKIRLCLIFVVLLAITVGTFYYFYTGESINEWGQGTLITAICVRR